jgi:gamma-glutamyltranspeptidase/glutathione hydrolase
MSAWRKKTFHPFETEKTSVVASRGIVAANHPLASAAGAEALAAGGNAIDAAIAALFALTVVEPMMVGIVGGGTALLRLGDGRETVLDGMCSAPLSIKTDSFEPLSTKWPMSQETVGQLNRVGVQSVAVPGTLASWCAAVERFGRLSLDDLLQPAIRHAERGFVVSPYLANSIRAQMPDISKDLGLSAILCPGGEMLRAGDLLVQPDYASTLRGIAREGAAYLHGGALGRAIVDHIQAAGGFLAMEDLTRYEVIEREPVRIDYRGFEVVGVPPPCAGGLCISEILNILEGHDISAMGFGSAAYTHLLLESLKAATIDRDEAIGDPAFVTVPLERMISKEYAAERRALIDPSRANIMVAGLRSVESANTTHVTVADGDGNIITSTQTINSLFGACIVVPGTGAILNNYMYVFNPHPGFATSIAPGKRVTGNIGATICKRDGKPIYALGLPGGFKIPSVVAQAVVNLIDHGMSLQEAVEAPRVFAKGPIVELEKDFNPALADELRDLGHPVEELVSVGGCMGAIEFAPDGSMTGANCWRGDGAPVGIGGGQARAGVLFWPDPT